MGSSESGVSNSLLATNSLFSAFGDYRASEAQAKYTESVYQANEELFRMKADEATRRGDVEAGKYKKKVKSLLGSQRARMAAAGIDISDTDSSAYQIQEETLRMGYADAQQIKNNAFREALGLKTQGKLTGIEGKFKAATSRYQGRMSLITGGMKAASYGYNAYRDFSADKKQTSSPSGNYSGGSNLDVRGLV